jgi:enamine deaminase RidA (YjgF/YER057c/UK114 family)
MRVITPESSLATVGGYSHAVVASGDFMFISGQTPEAPDGTTASDPEQQLRQVWANVEAVLQAADLALHDLAFVRTYLSDRRHREVNSTVRREVLGEHSPALTVVICELYEREWVAEVEAIARASTGAAFAGR